MIKPFGVRERDWQTFNKNLHKKMEAFQKKGYNIVDVKYQVDSSSKTAVNPGREYSAIIIYDTNDNITNRG